MMVKFIQKVAQMTKRTTSIGFAHIYAILYGAQIMFTSAGNFLICFFVIPFLESVACAFAEKKTSTAIWCQAHLDDYIGCNSNFIMSYFLSNNDELRREKMINFQLNSNETHSQIHFQIQRISVSKMLPHPNFLFLGFIAMKKTKTTTTTLNKSNGFCTIASLEK